MTWIRIAWAWLRKRWIAVLGVVTGILFLLWRSEVGRRKAAEAEARARAKLSEIDAGVAAAKERSEHARDERIAAIERRAAERRRLAEEVAEEERLEIEARRRKDAEIAARPGGAADLWNAHHGRGDSDD